MRNSENHLTTHRNGWCNGRKYALMKGARALYDQNSVNDFVTVSHGELIKELF